MAQVLTSEGLLDFHNTGKIPEFVKPGDEPKTEAKAEVKAETKEPSPVSTAKAAKAETEVEDDDGLTADERKEYSEKVTRKISAKNRALKAEKAFADIQRRERQAAVDEASTLRAELNELKTKIPTAATDTEGPQRKDFASDGEWWDAKIDWKAEQKAEAKFIALEKKRETDRAEAAKQERIAKFADTVDDYNEVVEALKGVPQHQAVIDYLSDADLGPNLIYYFASHTDEYKKLASMKAVSAVAEVGKIETRLERKAEKVEKTEKADEALDTLKAPISRAPAPITTLHESATPVQKDPSKMNFEELRAYNLAERRRKAAG